MRLTTTFLATVLVALAVTATTGSSSAQAKAQAAKKPTTVRGLVVLGCRKYSFDRARCYASRWKHPEVKIFYAYNGKRPKLGRIADVRGWPNGSLIDTTAQPGSTQKTWTKLRGYARSTKVVAVVRSFKKKRGMLSFFVSRWSLCGKRTYYCMSQGTFKAKVPRALVGKATKAARSWTNQRKKVWLLTIKFKPAKSMRLVAIKQVRDNKRRR